MAGTGVRCARYLLQSGASHVHANDASRDAHDALLSTVCDLRANADAMRSSSAGSRPAAVTSRDARRLLAGMYAADDERFDIVDVDSFGVDNFVDAALPMVKHGGYAYVTCTDALALCGKNKGAVVSLRGAHVAANVVGVNETALRVFVGDAVRRGAAQGLKLTPVFSLFHPHGPVFRAMLRVERGGRAWTADDVGYVGQCWECGEARRLDGGKELGGCFCHQCADAGGRQRRDGRQRTRVARTVTRTRDDPKASARGPPSGWDDDEDASASGRREETPKGQKTTAKLLEMFESESDPKLPPFYHRTDELARARGGEWSGGYSADERVDRRVAKTRIRRVSISRRRKGAQDERHRRRGEQRRERRHGRKSETMRREAFREKVRGRRRCRRLASRRLVTNF